MAASQGPDVPGFTDLAKQSYGGRDGQVQENIAQYEARFEQNGDSEQHKKERIERSQEISDTFYELITDFYEYGYGRSFHFAPVLDGKTMDECIAEYEKATARLVKAKPGMKILDVGCGVGGPQRQIARYSGAHVVGLNIQAYQLKRARQHTEKEGLQKSCSYIQSDFCHMDNIEDNTFDGVYVFEASCHAPSPVDVYREIYRVMKPGAYFVDSNWTMTDSYDPHNPEHKRIKHEIEIGNGITELRSQQEVLEAMRTVGFEVVEFKNCHRDGDLPWYTFLVGKGWCSLQNFRASPVGRWITHVALSVLETVGMVPKGTTQVHSVLIRGCLGLIAGGKTDIFTPMFRLVARKPLES